jgi:hypothetical protein
MTITAEALLKPKFLQQLMNQPTMLGDFDS